MKTNFDKWKEGLNKKDLIVPRLVDDGRTKCIGFLCNSNCPASSTCPAYKALPKNIQRWRHFANKCDKWFLRWAKAEAKEEE